MFFLVCIQLGTHMILWKRLTKPSGNSKAFTVLKGHKKVHLILISLRAEPQITQKLIVWNTILIQFLYYGNGFGIRILNFEDFPVHISLCNEILVGSVAQLCDLKYVYTYITLDVTVAVWQTWKIFFLFSKCFYLKW